MITLLKKHLIVRVLCAMTVVMILIAGGYIGTQVVQTNSAVEEAINSYNIRIAESYAATLESGNLRNFSSSLRKQSYTGLFVRNLVISDRKLEQGTSILFVLMKIVNREL